MGKYAKYKIGDIANNKLKIIDLEVRGRTHDPSNKETYYTVECLECGYVREIRIANKTGCPCCTNKITVKGINDINTTHPHIGKMLKNYEDGYKYTIGTCTNLVFICPHCGQDIKKNPYKILQGEYACQHCRDTIPFGEKLIREILKERKVEFRHDVQLEWSGTKRYDFYIEKWNMIIETHGVQHYGMNSGWNKTEQDLEKQQSNDKLKEELAINNGIAHYVVLDTSKQDVNHALSQIIEIEELNSKLKVETLNKEKLFYKVGKPLMIQAVELWNNMESKGEEPTASIIAQKMNKDRMWAKNTLLKASKLGLCNYSQELAEERRKQTCRSKNGRRVKAVNRFTGEELIFETIKGASRELGYACGSIGNALSGRSSYSGDYYWSYVD